MNPQLPIPTNRAAYNRLAARYAQINAAMPAEVIRAAERFLQLLPPGSPYLDLGCGAGRDLAYLHSLGGCGTGADLTRGMLDQARQVCGSPLVQMEMTTLGFATQSFGGIWCNAALLHLPKALLPAALGEIRRVLVPSGIFYSAVQVGQGEGYETWPTPDGGVERFFARYHPGEYLAALQAAGFQTLEHGTNPSPGKMWIWAIASKGPHPASR